GGMPTSSWAWSGCSQRVAQGGASSTGGMPTSSWAWSEAELHAHEDVGMPPGTGTIQRVSTEQPPPFSGSAGVSPALDCGRDARAPGYYETLSALQEDEEDRPVGLMAHAPGPQEPGSVGGSLQGRIREGDAPRGSSHSCPIRSSRLGTGT